MGPHIAFASESQTPLAAQVPNENINFFLSSRLEEQQSWRNPELTSSDLPAQENYGSHMETLGSPTV